METTAAVAHSQPFKVLKVDAGRRLVFGYAMVAVDKGQIYVDSDKSYIPQDVILDSAIDFMLHSRKSDEMHNERTQGDVLFAWPFLDGISDDIAQPADGTRGLAVGVRFTPAVFAKFQSGEYTGFSGGGDAMAKFFKSDTMCPECEVEKSTCKHAQGGVS